MLQVNYLSPFLLTSLLLNLLHKSEQRRIINLTSSVYTRGTFDGHTLQSIGRGPFSVLGRYATTKLFVLMFTQELARRLDGTSVTANAVHPGIVRTRMMLQARGVLRPVYLASAPEVKDISGQYFTNSKVTAVKNKFDTADNRAILWDLTVDAAGAPRETAVGQVRCGCASITSTAAPSPRRAVAR